MPKIFYFSTRLLRPQHNGFYNTRSPTLFMSNRADVLFLRPYIFSFSMQKNTFYFNVHTLFIQCAKNTFYLTPSLTLLLVAMSQGTSLITQQIFCPQCCDLPKGGHAKRSEALRDRLQSYPTTQQLSAAHLPFSKTSIIHLNKFTIYLE